MVSLHDSQFVAVRTPSPIDPRSVIQPNGLDDKRVIIHPFANRIAVPPGLGIFGKLAAVGPDDPPNLAERVHDQNLQRRLNDLRRPHLVEVLAGHTLGIAGYHRIVCLGRQNAPDRVARLVLAQGFLPRWSVRQPMLRPAVFRHGLRAELPDSAVAWVPRSRQVMARCRQWFLTLRRRGHWPSPTIVVFGCRGSGLSCLLMLRRS